MYPCRYLNFSYGTTGTASIGKKLWKALCKASPEAQLVYVASRDIEKAKQFIDVCQGQCPMKHPPTPLGSYDELLAMKDVDVVYIPLPTGLRLPWILRAAEAKKVALVISKGGIPSLKIVFCAYTSSPTICIY